MSVTPGSGNVFIGWAGPHSKKVAAALRDWLPDVIQGIAPWMSEVDLPKGTPWFDRLATGLEDIIVGVFCLTPDNLGSEWMHFEAGMVAKQLSSGSRVCPYLVGVKKTDLQGPFRELQATDATEADTLELLRTINNGLGASSLAEERLTRAFNKSWDDLRQTVEGIRSDPSFGMIEAITPRPTEQILEELAGGMQRIEYRVAQLHNVQQATARTIGVPLPQQVFHRRRLDDPDELAKLKKIFAGGRVNKEGRDSGATSGGAGDSD